MRVSCFSLADAFCRIGAMFSRRGVLAFAVFLLGFTFAFAGVSDREQRPQNPATDQQGTFLIARRSLSDPFFAKSTVLMLPIESYPLVVGLIINKPTKIKLAELFPHAKNLEKQDATAYFGGPVDIHDRSAIFRSPAEPKHALHLFADVYITFDSDSIDELVNKSKQPPELRIFLGRSQWSQAQLEHEILIGAWYKHTDDADPIFAADPGKVWQQLLDRAAPSPYTEYLPPPTRAKTKPIYSFVPRDLHADTNFETALSGGKNDLASRVKTRLHFILPARPAAKEPPAFVPRAEGTAS